MFMRKESEKRPLPLSTEAVEASRRAHGSNALSVKKKKGFWSRYLESLGDPVIRILLGALALNLLFLFKGGDVVETAGIALAVLLATLISTVSECGSEAAFARLTEACTQATCRVRRRLGRSGEATVYEVAIGDVVVGDTVLLGAGEMIPADGFLLTGHLQVDQSAMTGESREVEKWPCASMASLPEQPTPADSASLLRGCLIVGGGGEMLVARVGDHTYLGEISDEVQADTRESPLKLRLGKLAGQISRLGYIAAALVAVIALLSAFLFESGFDRTVILAKLSDWRYVWMELFGALTLGLTVLVVAVPEGLPMMIAVVLSANIRRMARDHVLVRKAVGIEAAGSMNLLFCDKTGTLTEGRLSIGRILLGDGMDVEDIDTLLRRAPRLADGFCDAALTNTDAVPGMVGGETILRALGGNATDRALMDAVLAVDPKRTPSELLRHTPFDSRHKLSTSVVRRRGEEILYIKGSPEALLPRLRHAYRSDGSIAPLDRRAIERRLDAVTANGGRVILLAEGRRSPAPGVPSALGGEEACALTFVAAVLLTDRLRPEAPLAVAQLRRAGIQVVMMTGDNRDTAAAIATGCGILDGGIDLVLDSTELASMSDGRVRELLPRIGVIARALPSDKSRLVRIAQEAELVVGMTGDGINDAPALKRADIGFAMGAGTQVAKDAGDIIILDNNLASIARAVLYGRTIFKSIRKFITLQLTMNLSAVGVTMIAPFIGVESPVTVVQMLWINLIMDTLGGLAFAGEAPLASYMEERPKRRDEPILNRYMIGEMVWLGLFTVALSLFFLKSPTIEAVFRPAEDDIYHLTAFFALFIFASVFNCFNARTDRLKLTAGLGQNRAFLGIMATVLAVQLLFVYIGGSLLRTAPLTTMEMSVTFLMALAVFPAELVRKLWRRMCGKREGY